MTQVPYVYRDQEGNLSTNYIWEVDQMLEKRLEKLDSIAAIIEPFNPEAGKTKVALAAVSGTLLTVSGALAGWKNRRKLKRIAGDATESMTQFFRKK